MRLLSFLPLLLALGTASAASTTFEMEAGETREFLVTGSEPSVSVHRGQVEVVDMTAIGPTVWIIELYCGASSTDGCAGEISS